MGIFGASLWHPLSGYQVDLDVKYCIQFVSCPTRLQVTASHALTVETIHSWYYNDTRCAKLVNSGSRLDFARNGNGLP